MADRSEKTGQLPDWFTPDLYKYENTPEYWLEEISRRIMVVISVQGPSNLATEFFLETIVRREKPSWDYGSRRDYARGPVSNLSVFEATYLSNLWLEDKSQRRSFELAALVAKPTSKAAMEITKKGSRDELNKLNETASLREPGSEGGFMQRYIMDGRLPISIDITLDNKTLKHAFEDWLKGIRDVMGNPKKLGNPIGEKDFVDWSKYAVLPAFDLLYWKALGQIKLTDAAIGYLLWPDQDPSIKFDDVVDTTDRYRRTTKPLIWRVISSKMYERLRRQTTLEKRI